MTIMLLESLSMCPSRTLTSLIRTILIKTKEKELILLEGGNQACLEDHKGSKKQEINLTQMQINNSSSSLMLSPLADLTIRTSFGTLETSNIKGLQRVKTNREFHRTLIQCMPMKVRASSFSLSNRFQI